MMINRKLTPAEKTAYAASYPDEQSRKPVAIWPREIPFDGQTIANMSQTLGGNK